MTQKSDKIDIFQLLVPVAKRKKLFLAIVIFGIVYGIYYAKKLPNLYQATASIYPLNSGGSSMGALGGMGQALGMMGMQGLGIGAGTGSDRLLVFLKSKSLAERVLLRLYNEVYALLYPSIWDSTQRQWRVPESATPYKSDVIKAVNQMMFFDTDDKNVVILARAETQDPVFSKLLVDTYLAELKAYLAENDLTVAQKNKTFIKKQLLKSERKLLEQSKILKKYHDIFNVRSQAPLITVTLNEEADPTIDEEVLRDLSSPDLSPERAPDSEPSEEKVVIKNIPADLYYYYLSSKKELQHMLNKGLEREYQSAIISADKEKLEFTVVDQGEMPTKRSRPNRTFIVLIAAAVATLFAFVGVHLAEGCQHNYRSWVRRYKALRQIASQSDS